MIPLGKHLDYALGYIALNLLKEARAELGLISVKERDQPDVIRVRLELAMAECAWGRVLLLAPSATKAEPSVERPWTAWAYALRELQHIERARDVLLRGEKAIEEPSVLVDYNLACYFCLLGDLATARRRLARVFEREPAWKEEAARDPDLARLHTAADADEQAV